MKNLFGEDEKVQTEEKEIKSKKATFGYSPFALQDAIGEKNVKKIWLEYEKLRLSGIEAEELIHKIISKVRDMLAISQGASKQDLGIEKDYPYDKSKRDARNWRISELENLYSRLVKNYHEIRMIGGDLDLDLEKTLLNI
jgi:DNA polymerase III gamma/tau subunit